MARTGPDRGLTAKQAKFVDEYIKDCNATQAAIRAGYTPNHAHKTGSQLLGKSVVSTAIFAAQKKRSEKTEIDAEWVLRRAAEVHNRCMQKEPVLDADGNETGEYKFDSAGALRALDLIGKHTGVQAFESKLKLNHDISITVTSGIDLPPGQWDEITDASEDQNCIDGI